MHARPMPCLSNGCIYQLMLIRAHHSSVHLVRETGLRFLHCHSQSLFMQMLVVSVHTRVAAHLPHLQLLQQLAAECLRLTVTCLATWKTSEMKYNSLDVNLRTLGSDGAMLFTVRDSSKTKTVCQFFWPCMHANVEVEVTPPCSLAAWCP